MNVAAEVRELGIRAAPAVVLAGAGIVLAGWLLATGALGAAVGSVVSCDSCHSMREWQKSLLRSAHADLSCLDCHRPSGSSSVGAGFGVQRRAVSEVLGRRPAGATFDDSPCRSCHRSTLGETLVSRGIRIRHDELLGRPCLDCHGGTGHAVGGRLYGVAQMQECVECHSASPSDSASCDYCHDPSSQSRGARSSTVWRSTHGANWESTHGTGDLRSCISCHEPSRCASCHGVALPHGGDWQRGHGDAAVDGVEACRTCHESEWCAECHGNTEMPHPSGFVSAHGKQALSAGSSNCIRCHLEAACDNCHLRSSHPDIPGLGSHGGGPS